MTSQDLWKRYQEYFVHYPELGMSIDISRISFESDFFDKMSAKMTTAFKQMAELEKGAVANPDEKRMVGHYWLRSPELAPTAEITDAVKKSVADIKKFATDIHSGKIKPQKTEAFKNVLIVGIGGSALGPQLTQDATTTAADKMTVMFLDNTDPDGIARVLDNVGRHVPGGLGATLVVVTSKSGGTPETRNGALEVAAAYKAQGLDHGKHFVAVTCPGSKLDNQTQSEGWLKSFAMWDWVGGRTSLFAAVGLLPAALQGVNIDDLLTGGKIMDEITRRPDPKKNPAALLAQMWFAAGDGRGKKDMVVLPYKDRLVLMSKYLQQLVMESLGKEKDLAGNVVHQGIAVYGNKGSTDQHAYVQQLRDGLNNFFATFIEVLSDHTGSAPKNQIEVDPGVTCGDYLSGFLQGTRRALYENGRGSITVTVDVLSAKTLGALVALFDRAVGLYASLVNVNAYHQPGVEAGKKAAARVLEIQNKALAGLKAAKSPISAEQLASQISAPEEAETVYKILEHLASNPGRGVQRIGGREPGIAKYQSA